MQKQVVIELGREFELPYEYGGYTICASDNAINGSYMFYPSDHEGPDHDYDWTGDGYRYCGNCKYATCLNEALIMIDELNEL